MPERFGCAASLYERHEHPRVLMDRRDLAKIRRLVRSGEGKKVHVALRAKVEDLASKIEKIDNLPLILSQWNDRWDLPGTPIVWGLHDVAFMGELDNDARLIGAAKRVMLALPEADRLKGRKGKLISYGFEPYVPLAFDLLHAHMDEAERAKVVQWMADLMIRHTITHIGPYYLRAAGQNIPMGEVLAGMMAVLLIEGEPSAPDLSAEKKTLVTFLEATCNSVVGPDGYPYEDVGYGSAMGGWTAYVAHAAFRAGALDVYDRCPAFGKFGRAMLHFVQPWGGHLSNTGDHGDDFGERCFVLAKLASRQRDGAVEWLRRNLFYPSYTETPQATMGGRYGETPLKPGEQLPTSAFTLMTLDEPPRPVHPSRAGVPTHFADRGRGIVSMRSDWSERASLVVFDGSQRSAAAPGHDHASGGHVSFFALGEYFAIDTGRYNIEQDQHNVVVVNGKSGRSTHGEWRFTPYAAVLTGSTAGELVDTATADYSHQSNCCWARRTVGLVRGEHAYAWTAEDLNFDNGVSGVNEYWWLLNTHPDNRIELGKTHATIRGCRHGNLLDVHFAIPAASSFPSRPHSLALEKNLQVSGSHKYIPNPLERAEAMRQSGHGMVHGPVYARPRLVAKVTGYHGRFLSVMLPRGRGASAAEVRRFETLDNSLGLAIRWGDVEDTLIWSYEHGLLEGNGVSARGQWCVVRRQVGGRRAGVVKAYQVGAGTRIEVDGKRLPLAASGGPARKR